MDTLHLHEIPFFSELRQELSEICSRFTPALKAKDLELHNHSLHVQSLALAFTSTVLHLTEAEALTIGLAASFHDLGKLNISENILHKASGLTRHEFERMQEHPAYCAHMLNQIKLIKHVVPSVYHHHERLDGTGYPDGIRGAAIPLRARIIAIVDAFEVMTSHRIYQKSRSAHQACEELYEHAGTQFDAQLVERFCTSFNLPLLNIIHVPWKDTAANEQKKQGYGPFRYELMLVLFHVAYRCSIDLQRTSSGLPPRAAWVAYVCSGNVI